MYKITIYNQHAECGIFAKGKSKPKAFAAAMQRAGAEYIRYGEDKSGRDHSAIAHKLFSQCCRDMGSAFAIYQNSHAGIGLAIERIEA